MGTCTGDDDGSDGGMTAWSLLHNTSPLLVLAIKMLAGGRAKVCPKQTAALVTVSLLFSTKMMSASPPVLLLSRYLNATTVLKAA